MRPRRGRVPGALRRAPGGRLRRLGRRRVGPGRVRGGPGAVDGERDGVRLRAARGRRRARLLDGHDRAVLRQGLPAEFGGARRPGEERRDPGVPRRHRVRERAGGDLRAPARQARRDASARTAARALALVVLFAGRLDPRPREDPGGQAGDARRRAALDSPPRKPTAELAERRGSRLPRGRARRRLARGGLGRAPRPFTFPRRLSSQVVVARAGGATTPTR